jgi:hypothetical protein
MEDGDHDELAPVMFILACWRLTVFEKPLTLVAVSEN